MISRRKVSSGNSSRSSTVQTTPARAAGSVIVLAPRAGPTTAMLAGVYRRAGPARRCTAVPWATTCTTLGTRGDGHEGGGAARVRSTGQPELGRGARSGPRAGRGAAAGARRGGEPHAGHRADRGHFRLAPAPTAHSRLRASGRRGGVGAGRRDGGRGGTCGRDAGPALRHLLRMPARLRQLLSLRRRAGALAAGRLRPAGGRAGPSADPHPAGPLLRRGRGHPPVVHHRLAPAGHPRGGAAGGHRADPRCRGRPGHRGHPDRQAVRRPGDRRGRQRGEAAGGPRAGRRLHDQPPHARLRRGGAAADRRARRGRGVRERRRRDLGAEPAQPGRARPAGHLRHAGRRAHRLRPARLLPPPAHPPRLGRRHRPRRGARAPVRGRRPAAPAGARRVPPGATARGGGGDPGAAEHRQGDRGDPAGRVSAQPVGRTARSSPSPISPAPNTMPGVRGWPSSTTPSSVPTTGWAKKNSEATAASTSANARFQSHMAPAVDTTPRYRIPATRSASLPCSLGRLDDHQNAQCGARSSTAARGTAASSPPTNAQSVTTSVSCAALTWRTSTEYSPQVSAAAASAASPQAVCASKSARVGSTIASTPAVASPTAATWRRVRRSCRMSDANSTMQAGEALVISAPWTADASAVPTNWAPTLTPKPTTPTPTRRSTAPAAGRGKRSHRASAPSTRSPSSSRRLSSVNGGTTRSTTSDTTYMPPQMAPAPQPYSAPRPSARSALSVRTPPALTCPPPAHAFSRLAPPISPTARSLVRVAGRPGGPY